MTRRTMAERKRRASERDARRESLLVLLSRTRRGVPLTDAEAGLLFAHVEVELAEADELRRTVAGQQTAIQATGRRAEAADAVIVEVEKDRDQARAELAELQAAAKQAQQRARVERAAPDADHAAMNRHLDTMRTRAKQAEAALARVRDTTHRMRATSPQGAAAIYADRIEQAIADDPYALTPEQTAAHLAFGAAADSTEARLAEQQRAHEIELATVRRNAKQLGEALAVTRSKLHDTRARRDDARAGREDAERRGDRAEEQLAAAHRRGDGWRNHALEADHRADRYRTAWFAARRDRKADRAAMAAELPLVEAARSLLTSRAPQQLARP